MRTWVKCLAGLALAAGLVPTVWGQFAPPPGAPGAPPAPAPAPPPPGGAAPNNLWAFLCLTPEQKQQCKDKICKTQLGQLMNNGMKPIGALTGGLFGSCCPSSPFGDLLKPPDSAEGAAARIQADEAAAKARRAAVRYLATVDCRYWPEARDALVGSLRGDRNECVRWEAAMAMGSGCCCNKEILRALAIVVSGSEADGNPAEVSLRVKAAAAASLDRCLECVAALPPPILPPPVKEEKQEKPPERPGERPATPPNGTTTPSALPPVLPSLSYYYKLDKVSMEQVVREGKLVLQHHGNLINTHKIELAAQHESNTLYDVVMRAARPGPVVMAGPELQPAVALNTVPVVPAPATYHTVVPAVATNRPAPTPAPMERQPEAKPAPLPEKVVTPPPPPPPAPKPAEPKEFKMEFKKEAAPQVSKPTPPPPPAPAPATLKLQPEEPKPAPKPVAPAVLTMPPQEKEKPAKPTTIAIPTTPALGKATAPKPLQLASHTAPLPENDPIKRLVSDLRSAQEAARREKAANDLARVNWQSHPEVLDPLVEAVRSDKDQAVRLAAIRALGRMNASTTPVTTVLKDVQTDRDRLVQQEAWTVLMQLVSRSTQTETR